MLRIFLGVFYKSYLLITKEVFFLEVYMVRAVLELEWYESFYAYFSSLLRVCLVHGTHFVLAHSLRSFMVTATYSFVEVKNKGIITPFFISYALFWY